MNKRKPIFLLFLILLSNFPLTTEKLLKRNYSSNSNLKKLSSRTLRCYNGYYYTTFGYCLKCAFLCQTCQGSATYCTACFPGYKLSNNSCAQQEIQDCTSPDYIHDESLNQSGICQTDCDCNGTRRCSPFGKCEDCSVLAQEYPFFFQC